MNTHSDKIAREPSRKGSRVVRRLLVLGLILSGGSLQAGWLEDIKSNIPGKWGAPPHRVVDSGYWVPNNAAQKPYWVDNQRVLFVGGTRAERERYLKEGFASYVTYLYVWDTQANRVSIHSKLPNPGAPCFNRGYVRYLSPTDSGDQMILMSGPFGQEAETLVDRKHDTDESRKSRGMLYSELRCKEYPYADILIGEKRGLFPLLEGDGYLDIYADPFIPDRKMEPVRWYKDRNGSPVDLPIVKRETAEHMVSYMAWSGSYLIATVLAKNRVHNPGDWPKNVPRPVYLMKPGGAVQRLDVPYADRISSNAWKFFHARVGMLILSGSTTATGPGKAGVYVWTEGNAIQRVISGAPNAAALSPDGCKLAIAIDPRDHGGSDRYYLKMIDFCAKGDK